MPNLSTKNDAAVSTILNSGDFEVAEINTIKKAMIDVIAGDRVFAASAGTVFSLTTNLDEIVFGTVSPTVTIQRDGAYLIDWYAAVEGNAATTDPTNVITVSIYLTRNGVLMPMGNSATNTKCPVMTTSAQTIGNLHGPQILTDCLVGDVITIRGRITPLPAAGTADVTKAVVSATRLY